MSGVERSKINIHGATMSEVSVLSSGTEFCNDGRTSITAEVSSRSRHVPRNAPVGTLGIADSAVESLVVGSKDTVIDNRGAKSKIKISAGEGDDNGDVKETGTVSGNVVVNAIVDSSDTKISMEGARINIKRKKKKNGNAKSLQVNDISLTNSAAVNLVAYSERTEVDMRDSEINIE